MEPIQIFCGELTNKRANELIRRTGRLAKRLINEITTSIQQSHEKAKNEWAKTRYTNRNTDICIYTYIQIDRYISCIYLQIKVMNSPR